MNENAISVKIFPRVHNRVGDFMKVINGIFKQSTWFVKVMAAYVNTKITIIVIHLKFRVILLSQWSANLLAKEPNMKITTI